MQVIADPRGMAGEKVRLPALGPDTGRSLPIAEFVFNGLTLVCLSIGLPTDCAAACNALHAQTSAVDYLRISRAVS